MRKIKGFGKNCLSMSGKLFYCLRTALETAIRFPFSRIWLFFCESQHSWKYIQILNVETMTYCFWYYLLSRMILRSTLQYISDQQCLKQG